MLDAKDIVASGTPETIKPRPVSVLSKAVVQAEKAAGGENCLPVESAEEFGDPFMSFQGKILAAMSLVTVHLERGVKVLLEALVADLVEKVRQCSAVARGGPGGKAWYKGSDVTADHTILDVYSDTLAKVAAVQIQTKKAAVKKVYLIHSVILS